MQEKQILLEEGAITYLIHGTGPNLLFLHGGFATPRSYIPFIELIGQHYTVIAPTHPGHGASFALPLAWDFAQYGITYRHFFQALHLGPLVIVGHSFGGAIGLLLASYGLATLLVAFDSAGLPVSVTKKKYVETLSGEAKESLPEILKRKQLATMLSATSQMLYSTIKHPESIPWLETQGTHLDLTAILSTINTPIRLLWGKRDRIIPYSVGERMQRLLPRATLTVFPSYGHGYIITNPKFAYQEMMNVVKNM